MKSPLSELRKHGVLDLPHGGKLTREGNKAAIYEAVQKIRVPLPLDPSAVEAALVDQPILILLQSLMGLNYADVARKIASLTPRELQVFGELGMGLKNTKIAEDLGISPKTLDIHRANIGRKIGLKTANAFGRIYWFFRLCHEFYPQTLAEIRKQNAME